MQSKGYGNAIPSAGLLVGLTLAIAAFAFLNGVLNSPKDTETITLMALFAVGCFGSFVAFISATWLILGLLLHN